MKLGRRRLWWPSVAGALMFVFGGVGVASAAPPPECEWEWGGVPEMTPAPCTERVPVDIVDPLPVAIPGPPVPVEVETPLPVSVPNPLPVAETNPVQDVNATVDSELTYAVTLGLGLIVFLLALRVVHSWTQR